MSTHINASRHFRLYGAVLAMAALLAVLLAVTLAAGPAQAQVTASTRASSPGPETTRRNTAAPYPCSEEAQPDANTVGEIRDGYYAVFDGFWDYEVGHLSNNFCPPEVTVTTETHDPTPEIRRGYDVNGLHPQRRQHPHQRDGLLRPRQLQGHGHRQPGRD